MEAQQQRLLSLGVGFKTFVYLTGAGVSAPVVPRRAIGSAATGLAQPVVQHHLGEVLVDVAREDARQCRDDAGRSKHPSCLVIDKKAIFKKLIKGRPS